MKPYLIAFSKGKTSAHIQSSFLVQCDQIGRFIKLWAAFQSLRPQLICINLLHSEAIFVKVSKTLIFSSEIIFWATFIDIWRFFTGHTVLLHTPNCRC